VLRFEGGAAARLSGTRGTIPVVSCYLSPLIGN
jgi:hypothetical protein